MKPIQIIAILQNQEELAGIRYALDKLQLYYELHCVESCAGSITTLAEKTARKSLPDLVLIDNEMPGIDSISIIREIRCRQSWRHIPCFLLVSPGTVSSFDHLEEEGFSGCINKPFSLNGSGTAGSIRFTVELLNRPGLR